jgi:hypothetical protein
VSSVVLPAPDGPVIATASSGSTATSRGSSPAASPPATWKTVETAMAQIAVLVVGSVNASPTRRLRSTEDRRRDRELSASSIIGGRRSICSLRGGPVPDAGAGKFCSAAYAIGDKRTISSTCRVQGIHEPRSWPVVRRVSATIPCDSPSRPARVSKRRADRHRNRKMWTDQPHPAGARRLAVACCHDDSERTGSASGRRR